VCDRTRDLLNSELGWTGLGHWDSSRIESSVLRVRSAVVDAQIAERIIRAVLQPDPPGFAIESDPPEARTPPDLIRVAYEDSSSRTDALGRHADGQFLALITGTGQNRPGTIAVALLLFDHVGTLVRTDIRDVPLSDADAVRDQLIQGLADVVYGDIAIRTFSVEADGVTWCLVDETDDSDEDGQPRVSLYPLDMLFRHPWDGTYDT
jgi:hypothetical protein